LPTLFDFSNDITYGSGLASSEEDDERLESESEDEESLLLCFLGLNA
jgi:hypothetical protein